MGYKWNRAKAYRQLQYRPRLDDPGEIERYNENLAKEERRKGKVTSSRKRVIEKACPICHMILTRTGKCPMGHGE